MNWYIVDKKYINYLTQFDSHVGYVEYGERLKLHVGTLLTIWNFHYYVPISSAKPKHQRNVTDWRVRYVNKKDTFLLTFWNCSILRQGKNLVWQYTSGIISWLCFAKYSEYCQSEIFLFGADKYNQIDCFRSFKSDKEKINLKYALDWFWIFTVTIFLHNCS